jgi:trimeric autotransporter adhesin
MLKISSQNNILLTMRNILSPKRVSLLAFFSFVFIFFSVSSKAQYNITLGSGTAANTSTTFPCPLQDTFLGAKTQYLFRVGELKAQGMDSGTINSIAFAVTRLNSHFGTVEGLSIKMGTTTANVLGTTTWVGNLKTVFTPKDYTVSVGRNVFVLDTTFDWDGLTNLVVEVCNGSQIGTTTSNPSILHHTPGFAASRTFAATNFTVGSQCNFTGTTAVAIQNPNLRPITYFNWTPKDFCLGVPVVGNITANATLLCPSIELNLTATGGTFLQLIEYQWQKFDFATGEWVATGPTDNQQTLSLFQDTTNRYRLMAICGLTIDTAYSNVVTVTTPKVPGGMCYIDKNHTGNFWPLSDTFPSFASTVTAMNCGIKSAVTFNVVPGSGPYNEQMLVNGVIINSSATNTITYNGNGETITFAPTTNSRAVIKIKGSKYFTLQNLNIVPTGNFAIGVQLQNRSDSNVVKNCTINLPTSGTAFTNLANSAGVVIGGTDASATGLDVTSNCNYNSIEGNRINGGANGIVLSAGNGGENTFNRIKDDTVRNFNQNGIFISGTFSSVVEHNLVSRPNAASSNATVNGIYVATLNRGLRVLRNKIHSPFKSQLASTATFNGINFDNATVGTTPSAVDEINVANNLIYGIQGLGQQNGILNTNSSNVQLYHNTISLDDETSNPTIAAATTRCYSQQGAPTSITFVNNLLYINRGGSIAKHCVFINAANANNFKDLSFNNYVNDAALGTTNCVGFWTANRLTIGDWINASGENTALNIPPVFEEPIVANMDTAKYNPTNAVLDTKGKAVYDLIDLNGPTTTRVDIGCYEFVPPPCNPALLNGKTDFFVNNKKVFSDTTVCENIPVSFKLKITGATGSLTTYQWEQVEDTVNGTPIDFGIPLVQPDTTFNSFANNVGANCFYYRCKIACGATFFYSDWRAFCVYPAMVVGNYTIESGSAPTYLPGQAGGNFVSYKTAIDTMRYCGIKGAPGNVVFNIVPLSGPYNEQILIDSIKGATPTRQVVFNGNGTIIQFPAGAPTIANDRAVIKLRRALHINFDSIVVNASAPTNFGYGIQLIGNSDSNTVRNCTIRASTSQTGNGFAGIVINNTDAGPIALGNTFCDDNKFINNTIDGGFYGMTVVGSGTIASGIARNEVINNKFTNFYNTGLYVAGATNTNIIGNSFSRPTRVNVVAGTGISLTGAPSQKTIISKNRLFDFFGGVPTSAVGATGISFAACDATANNENLVVNNVIYNLGGLGNVYPLSNNSSDFVNYYHNSISIKDTTPSAAATAGFFQTGAAININFRNNMIEVDRRGTGNKYALHFATTGAGGSTIVSNYNNIFSTSFTGFFGSARKSLTDWKAASNSDANSVAFDPLYANVDAGNLRPQFYLLDNIGLTGFATDDVENAVRSTTPDMGAYEFVPPACATPLVAGIAQANPTTALCLEEKINLSLNGNSPLGSIYFQWQDSAKGSTWQNLGPRLFNPTYDTVSSLRSFYRCIVTCALNGESTISTITNINLGDTLTAGTFTIDSSKANATAPFSPGDNFIDFNSAIAAMGCGITGNIVFEVYAGLNNIYNEQVRMPYIKGSKSTATITFQGVNGNAAGTTLQFAGTSTSNYTLRYDSTTYVTFKDLNIVNTSNTNGRVVEFFNRANNSSLVNCNISTPSTTVTTTTNAAVFANQFRGFNINIKGNKIQNGSNGIYISGTNNTAGNLTGKGIVIDSNTVDGVFAASIFTQFADRLSILRNTVNLNATTNVNNSGIFATFCDSGFVVRNNKVNINNQTTAVFGIQILNSRNKRNSGYGFIEGNEVYANTGNTAKVVGLSLATSDSLIVKNNVIGINSGRSASFGIVNSNHTAGSTILYYNNTVQMNTNDTTSVAAQLTQTNGGKYELRNNIFSNIGGGKAVFMNATGNFSSNYNMLYTNGKNLAHTGNLPANFFGGINQWRRGTNQDRWSINYTPAFLSPSDLRPNLTEPNVWAMHGRGIQIINNSTDINNVSRPTILTDGAPDLGAYEFYPTVLPPTLPSVPSVPTANTVQRFYFGSDTVMTIKWDINAPATCDVKRYSGVVPPTLNDLSRCDSMYFYTTVETSNANSRGDIEVYYLDPWLGSIPSCGFECQLGVGKNNQINIWNVNPTSNNNTRKKFVYQTDVNFFDKFTGLINQYINCNRGCSDTSNLGTEFWTAYPANQLNGGEVHKIYISAPYEDAEVNITVPNTNTFIIPANTIVPAGTVGVFTVPNNSGLRKQASGTWSDAIQITSSTPIVAYQHFYGSTSSSATMLMPKCTWGFQYSMLARHQDWGGFSFSSYFVVAAEDSTKIATFNTASPQGVPQIDTITLMAGQWYQVLAADSDDDLVGSFIKSVPNNKGVCFPFAMFSGDTRTLNGRPCSGGGDFLITQNFATTTWGKRYLTAPTTQSNNAIGSATEKNLFRISLSNVNQIVRINGVQVYPTGTPPACVEQFLISATPRAGGSTIPAYLEFLSQCTLEIKSDKRLMVSQFLSGACSGVGDPDQTFISSIEQGVRQISFYRTDSESIDVNALVLIGSRYDVPALSEVIPPSTAATPIPWTHSYIHWDTTKMVYVKQWPTAARRQVNVVGDSIFTAITYGLGSVESYMYNAGTNILNFYVPTDPPCNEGLSDADCKSYTCAGTRFRIKTKVAEIFPDSIRFFISNIPGMTPSGDIVIRGPLDKYITNRTVRSNGDSVWTFQLDTFFSVNTPGNYTLIMKMWNEELEGCDKSLEWRQPIQVLPAPRVNFLINPSSVCEKTNVTFFADTVAQSGLNVKDFTWKSSPYGINYDSILSRTISFFYAAAGTDTVRLRTRTTDNCIGDTSQLVVINPNPVVTVVKDSVHVCAGDSASIQISNPIAGVTYYVYDANVNGNLIDSGNGIIPFVFNNILQDSTYYIEAKSVAGCMSEARKMVRVKVTQIPQPIANPVTKAACIGASVTFDVTSATDASTTNNWYDANTAGNLIFTGNNFTVNPVTTDASYYLEAVSNGCISNYRFAVNVLSIAPPTFSLVADTVRVCNADNATFNIQNPIATVTYNWYTVPTGGTATLGTSFTLNNVSANGTYYVSATSQEGCNSLRTPIQLRVTQRPVLSVIQPDSVSLCNNQQHRFVVLNPQTGVTYNWYNTATGGTAIKDSFAFTTPVMAGTNANYFVEGTDAGCTSFNRVTVKTTYLPQLASTSVTGSVVESNFIKFDWTPVPNATGYTITVSVNGGTPTTTSYGSSAITHNVNNLNPGDSAVAYVVSLGINSCANSDSAIGRGKTVPKTSYYPNTFTPNGDGKNDKIVICGLSIKSLQYSVWNQWGEKIWETTATNQINNCFELWDGTQRGVLQPVGVYMYISRITYLDGKVEDKKGTINLIR